MVDRSVSGVAPSSSPFPALPCYADLLSRWTSLAYTGAGSTGDDDVTRGYDNANNLTDVASANSGTYHYLFDELNRVTSQTWAHGAQTYSTSFGYDFAGCLTSMTFPTGDVLTLTCDTANRTRTITLSCTLIVSAVGYLELIPSGGGSFHGGLGDTIINTSITVEGTNRCTQSHDLVQLLPSRRRSS